ncbi:uspA domain protein [Halorubrum aidingense JCM 13560]|uniref:UspA domain protein n=1 Tax=Halorubrum aidingense JCM 13560 TaxID=1230454 RepID=M0PL99_9EURY|nr:universal stress protein [Halorubrum aidingense]EMA70807.1 uspA domain protein [Halorubrum aidingense JCM 13560]
MYEILLPVDDDTDRAAAQARYVSGLPGETDELSVTVAHAYRDDSRGTGDDRFDEESPGVIEATDILSAAGITVEQRELYVPVAESIVDLSDELDADEVVLCGRKRSPAGKALFGSVTQSVALESSVPVTIVPVEHTPSNQ